MFKETYNLPIYSCCCTLPYLGDKLIYNIS